MLYVVSDYVCGQLAAVGVKLRPGVQGLVINLDDILLRHLGASVTSIFVSLQSVSMHTRACTNTHHPSAWGYGIPHGALNYAQLFPLLAPPSDDARIPGGDSRPHVLNS